MLFRGNNLIVAKLQAWRSGNQIIVSNRAYLRDCKFYLSGRGNKIVIGDYCSLKGAVFYMCDDNNIIIIEDSVIVNADKNNPTRFNACNGCSIMIGSNCLFSNNIELHTTDYHPIINENKNRINQPSSIVIGEYSWIGLRSIILKGVEIAPHTVIGACSLVSRSVKQEYTVVAGNPATIIKSGVRWFFSLREAGKS